MTDGVRTGPVLCMGPIAMDMHVQAEAPADLDVLKHWIGSGAVSLQTGGSIGYTALALAGLGRRSVLRSTVGDDVFGREVLTQLTRLQVDVDGVSIAPGDTALAVYLRIFAGHKRPLVIRMPQHAPWPSEIALGEQLPAAVVVSGFLHFPEYAKHTVPPLLRACREQGVPTFVDPQFATTERRDPWLDEVAEIIALADVLSCNDDEAEQIFGPGTFEEMAAQAHALGCGTVVVKRGAKSTLVSTPDAQTRQPVAFIATRVESTVGSGDVFLAGIIDAVLRGEPFSAAVRWATAVAAAAITHPAGAAGVTSRAAQQMLEQVPRALERKSP